MNKDILKEVESLDQRIDALQHPAAEEDETARLLGEETTPAETESLARLEEQRAELLEQ